ncbi:ABC transporter permease [Butyrivibrio sp. CB08]|uniref:ABC transporter permease n=1 Tax=Butyrivibrio sp. CB08 TaxID=2364879 RepID=UPI000EA94957|nr:ABC transporter permease [Butyrivibrio sp. CB08]RKM61250.1 ABC transporter permease [Butyrivibrio sp. CB08]
MYQRLIINDLKKNKLTSIGTLLFMTVNAALLGLVALLFVNLSGSIDTLMNVAQTPDFLQMHAGDIHEEQIMDFARGRDDVEKVQICRFLNLPNSQLQIGDKSMDGNMQDNGLCVQSPEFDYLVDMDNHPIYPSQGDIYIPVCYRKEYDAQVGDSVYIGSEKLTIAGFLRDSQMNSMMASSKRFLVNSSDYDRLFCLGSEEYLIEFKLSDGSDYSAFTTAYEDAGLPGNGPTITYPLIRMMNALSDGMMILVILLIAVAMLFISMFCIRCLLFTQLEKDRSEIGMIKAIGLSRKSIRGLYLSKYLMLSAVGTVLGFIVALILAKPLSAQMRQLYGDTGNLAMTYVLMILGEVLVESIILFSISRTLRKIDKASTVEVLNGQGSFGKKKNLWIPTCIITAVSVFMILLPLNISNTLKAPEFVTYMGIGDSDVRIDIRQMDDIAEVSESLGKELTADDSVSDFVLMRTGNYKTKLPDGKSVNLLIENGDHKRFPVRYSKGSYPKADNEIALSLLNAQELRLSVGDKVEVFLQSEDGTETSRTCTVCGIYSDITNGGKTAKGCFDSKSDNTPVIWSIIYLSLKEPNKIHEWTAQYQTKYAYSGEGIKVTSISEYLDGTYGQTIRGIRSASAVTTILACMVLFVVVLLLLRLLIFRERSDSSLKKALGFTSRDVQKEYMRKVIAATVIGIALGVFAGVVPGQSIAGLFLGAMGAQGFKFIISPFTVFAFAPALALLTVIAAAFTGLYEIHSIAAYECLQSGTGR